MRWRSPASAGCGRRPSGDGRRRPPRDHRHPGHRFHEPTRTTAPPPAQPRIHPGPRRRPDRSAHLLRGRRRSAGRRRLGRQRRAVGPEPQRAASRYSRAHRPRSSLRTEPRWATSTPRTSATRSPGAKIPNILKEATIAIEDRRFYQHGALDYQGILRAAVKDAVNGGSLQGASTLTMQLVDNVYMPARFKAKHDLKYKIVQAKLAEQLEAPSQQELGPGQLPQRRPVRHRRQARPRTAWPPPRTCSSTNR